MKKAFAWLLAVAILLCLAACGNSEAPEATPSAAPTSAQGSEASTAPDSFQEITLVDNDACTIRITGMEEDSLLGYSLTAYFENKSPDVTYMFAVESAAINGLQTDPFFAVEVAPGKKASESISFSDDALDVLGEFTDIALSFRVYDTSDYLADPVATPTAHIYPLGEEKATVYTRTPQAGDNVILDNDQITVTVTGYRTDDIWGYTADLYIVNKTELSMMVTIDDASVNGFMADPFWAETVAPGKCAFSSVSWSDDTLSSSGITDVETIEFTLRAYDSNDWLSGDLVNLQVTLKPGE